jgi:hypothetical protein
LKKFFELLIVSFVIIIIRYFISKSNSVIFIINISDKYNIIYFLPRSSRIYLIKDDPQKIIFSTDNWVRVNSHKLCIPLYLIKSNIKDRIRALIISICGLQNNNIYNGSSLQVTIKSTMLQTTKMLYMIIMVY